MNLQYLIVVTAILAVIFFWLFVRSLRSRRLLGSGFNLLMTVLFVSVASLALAITLHLYTYARLTAEQPVARVGIQQLAPQRYNVTLYVPEKTPRNFVIEGDEWQLDARVLKWRGWAQLLGLDAQYRLDRISGRYRNISEARSRPPSVHELAYDSGPLDLWELAQTKPKWLPWVDAEYGSATFLPMRDTAQYKVVMTQTGLLARPDNTAAGEAVFGW